MPGTLLERDVEIDAIDEALAAACAGAGCGLVVEGGAGIGKTRLVAATGTAAEECGAIVLRAQGSEWECGFAYGVLRQLFEPVLRAADPGLRAQLLGGAAAPLERILELPGDQVGTDSLLTGAHGTFRLVARLVGRGPLVLVVDDGQWADGPSLRALGYLLRRVAGLPVLLVLVRRTGEPLTDPDAWLAVHDAPNITVLRPAPLSAQAVTSLVQAGLGADAGADFCAEVHRASAGNPLLVTALLGALREADLPPRDQHADAVRSRAPQIVASFVGPRLRRLSDNVGTVARVIAVFGDGAQVRHAAALTGLRVEVVSDAVTALTTAELLAPGRPLRFVHPLVSRAVLDSMSEAQRHTGHRAVAQLRHDEAAPAESVAAHLMVAEPVADPWVVAALRDAARSALGKGASLQAVRYLRRALAEPPVGGSRVEVLHELGAAQARADPTQAQPTLEAALGATTDPVQRARIALELGRVLLGRQDSGRGLPVLDQAIAELGATEPELRLRLEAELISAARLEPATRDHAYRRLDRLQALATEATAPGCALLAINAFRTLQAAGSTAAAVTLAERALAGLRALGGDDVEAHLLAVLTLSVAGRVEAAIAADTDAIDRARHIGSGLLLAMATSSRSAQLLAIGRLPDALAEAELGHQLSVEYDSAFPQQLSAAIRVLTLVEMGEIDAAVTAAAGIDAGAVALPVFALGRLATARGRDEEAIAHFDACAARLRAREMLHPAAASWQADAAVAAHRLGRRDDAARHADAAVAAATRYAAPGALGVALRAAGTVHGDPDVLRVAVEVLQPTPYRLEQAKALVDLGAAVRRSGNRLAARQPLQAGLDLAHHSGAHALTERARTELAATGLRPRLRAVTGPGALTPSERRTAELAMTGRSNREIAQLLFVTVKTVEVHLSSVYRKLGVSSRAELPGGLSAP